MLISIAEGERGKESGSSSSSSGSVLIGVEKGVDSTTEPESRSDGADGSAGAVDRGVVGPDDSSRGGMADGRAEVDAAGSFALGLWPDFALGVFVFAAAFFADPFADAGVFVADDAGTAGAAWTVRAMGVEGPASATSLLTAFSLTTLGVAVEDEGPAVDGPIDGASVLRDDPSGVEGTAGVEGAKEEDERDSLSLSGATLCTCSFAMTEGKRERLALCLWLCRWSSVGVGLEGGGRWT